MEEGSDAVMQGWMRRLQTAHLIEFGVEHTVGHELALLGHVGRHGCA